MKADIRRILSYRNGTKYLVQWLNDDGSIQEAHTKDTLSEALAWCRINDIGWWRAVGFSDEWIPIGEDKQP